jgi:hypothetical protein
MRLAVSIAVMVLAAALVPAAASAQAVEKGAFGVGIVIGEPTGVTAKLYLDDDTAVQAAIGSAFISGGLQAHADYLWHPWLLEERDSFALPVYIGPGARIIQYDQGRDGDDYVALGARAVAGFLFDFKAVPIDAFAEVAGVLELRFGNDEHDGLGVALNAGVGARYYF